MSGLIVKILVNDGGSRRVVLAELVKLNRKSLLVKMPGGKIVKRSKERDLVEERR